MPGLGRRSDGGGASGGVGLRVSEAPLTVPTSASNLRTSCAASSAWWRTPVKRGGGFGCGGAQGGRML
eukprot:5965956-Prymnesium_polylepis.1